MLRIAIIEDNESERQELSQVITNYFDEKQIAGEVKEYTNGDLFLNHYTGKNQFSLIFLDIDMPGKNGMETAECIRQIDAEVLLIFVTYMVQYAVQGYSVAACDFIVKPVVLEQLHIKLDSIIDRLLSRKKMITIRMNDGLRQIKISDICFIEVFGRKLILHTSNSQIEFYGTLKEMEKLLRYNNFAKCNKCYLVNLSYVSQIAGNEVVIADHSLQISRREKKHFIEALTRYDGGI